MKSYREQVLTLDLHDRKRNRPSKAAKYYRHMPVPTAAYRLEEDVAQYLARQGYSTQF